MKPKQFIFFISNSSIYRISIQNNFALIRGSISFIKFKNKRIKIARFFGLPGNMVYSTSYVYLGEDGFIDKEKVEDAKRHYADSLSLDPEDKDCYWRERNTKFSWADQDLLTELSNIVDSKKWIPYIQPDIGKENDKKRKC